MRPLGYPLAFFSLLFLANADDDAAKQRVLALKGKFFAKQGQVVEVEGVNFDYFAEDNLFSALITFSDVTNFEVFESDAVLVYRRDGVIDLSDGSTADAWTQLPQNYFLPEGTMQYVFAHTFVDVELFIDGNFDLSTISTEFTDDQLFRIVFVPSEFAESPDFDAANINSVMSKLQIDEGEVMKLDIN